MALDPDPTNWTDEQREYFAGGWNECLKMQPGNIERLRVALEGIATWSIDHQDARKRAVKALADNSSLPKDSQP